MGWWALGSGTDESPVLLPLLVARALSPPLLLALAIVTPSTPKVPSPKVLCSLLLPTRYRDYHNNPKSEAQLAVVVTLDQK